MEMVHGGGDGTQERQADELRAQNDADRIDPLHSGARMDVGR